MTAYATDNIDQIRVLTIDGQIRRIAPMSAKPNEGVGELVRRTVRHAGITNIAVVQTWGTPVPESPASADRDGSVYTWMPAELPVVAEAYRKVGLSMDDYLPAGDSEEVAATHDA